MSSSLAETIILRIYSSLLYSDYNVMNVYMNGFLELTKKSRIATI